VLAPNSRQSDRGSYGFQRFPAVSERERKRRGRRRIPLNHAENGSGEAVA
jgi:hypothetical protein